MTLRVEAAEERSTSALYWSGLQSVASTPFRRGRRSETRYGPAGFGIINSQPASSRRLRAVSPTTPKTRALMRIFQDIRGRDQKANARKAQSNCALCRPGNQAVIHAWHLYILHR